MIESGCEPERRDSEKLRDVDNVLTQSTKSHSRARRPHIPQVFFVVINNDQLSTYVNPSTVLTYMIIFWRLSLPAERALGSRSVEVFSMSSAEKDLRSDQSTLACPLVAGCRG